MALISRSIARFTLIATESVSPCPAGQAAIAKVIDVAYRAVEWLRVVAGTFIEVAVAAGTVFHDLDD